MHDCLKEMLQTEEKLERFELEAAIIGTRKPPFWVIRHSIESYWRDLYNFRGSGEGEGRGRRMGGPICFSRAMFLFHCIRFID